MRLVPRTDFYLFYSPGTSHLLSYENFILTFKAVITNQCCCLVPQSCLSLCNPVDCGPPDSSLRGIPQARILQWVAVSFPRVLPDPWAEPTSPVSPALAGGYFTTEPPVKLYYYQYPSSYRGRFGGSERLRNLPKVT